MDEHDEPVEKPEEPEPDEVTSEDQPPPSLGYGTASEESDKNRQAAHQSAWQRIRSFFR
jgi:hypothetical protein